MTHRFQHHTYSLLQQHSNNTQPDQEGGKDPYISHTETEEVLFSLPVLFPSCEFSLK
jgi:hypothetical protein